MGCLVAKIEDRETWVVYQSSTDSLFAPMFDSNLKAEMFANIYHKIIFDIDKYTETAQHNLALELSMFIEEMMPKGGKYDRPQVPKEWGKQIREAKDDIDEDEPDTRYDYDDLMDDVENSWKSRHVNVLDLLTVWFNEWKAGKKAAAAKQAKT